MKSKRDSTVKGKKPIEPNSAATPAKAAPASVQEYQIVKVRKPDGTIVRVKRPIKRDAAAAPGAAVQGPTTEKPATLGALTPLAMDALRVKATARSSSATPDASQPQPEPVAPTQPKAATAPPFAPKNIAPRPATAATASPPMAPAAGPTQHTAPVSGAPRPAAAAKTTASSKTPALRPAPWRARQL